MLKKIAVALGVLVLGFVLVVALQPSHLHVERSKTMLAPPEVVFAFVNDLKRWQNWSPWDKLDPEMQRDYADTTVGVGAKYSWNGNDKVGQGSMTITKSEPSEQVMLDLHFIKPWEGHNTATFRFEPAPHGTKLTWSMDGEQNFMAKAAGLFLDMDTLVGGDFEKGLDSLKALAEPEAQRMKAEAKAKAAAAEQADLEALIQAEAEAEAAPDEGEGEEPAAGDSKNPG